MVFSLLLRWISPKRISASVQTKQEEASFSLVTIPRLRWNNWNDCGNSTLKREKMEADGGGREGEECEWWKSRWKRSERTGVRSMKSSGVVSKSVPSLVCFPLPLEVVQNQNFLLLDQQVTKPAFFFTQPSVLLCLFIALIFTVVVFFFFWTVARS